MIEKLEATPGFTSLREKGKTSAAANQRIINGCDVPDSLIEDNPDFFATLDEYGIIRVGNYYYRYDYCNDKVWVISFANASNPANWTDFLNGNASNPAVGWFHTYVDVYEAVNTGYHTMPDTNAVKGNEIFERAVPGNVRFHEWKYFYDVEDEASTSSNTRMDGLQVYYKFGIFFHLYAKEKYQRYTWLGWQTMGSGTRNWKVDYQYQYQRKGQSNTSGSGTLNAPPTGEIKVERTFYQGNRGLLKYFTRWDVRNFTTYHSVRRKYGTWEDLIGTYQAFPASTPVHVYNYTFNQIVNYGSPSYYQQNFGY